MNTYSIKLSKNHGGPLYYLGNRYLSLPDTSGHMAPNNSWLNEHFSLILANNKGKKYKRVYEPFAGSASWSLAAMEIDLADEYVISDSNHVLINTHRMIKDKPALVKEAYSLLVSDYANSISKKDFFLESIKKYNQSNEEDEKSLILPFIINHSWSGILYYDSQFNLLYKDGDLFEGKNTDRFLKEASISVEEFFSEVDRVSNLLNSHKVIFKTGDYRDIIKDIQSGDFVALNPPYPENERSKEEKSTMYQELYSLEELHQNLIQTIQQLENQGIHYYMTYGFYNPELSKYVFRDNNNQLMNYFRILGYEGCAFGVGLDQVYFPSQFSIPSWASKSIIKARDVLEDCNLTPVEALKRFKHIQNKL
ncbi:Modification methylase DpnIIA [Legionella pneumophila]|nr:Modification methylase DpnIIA [Legionella pneumophila]CZH41081.1 Modification methylase DpnIIA [Legionella pneumophila]